MGPGWTRALRFSPGARLRCTLALPPAVRTALEQASTRAGDWLRALDGAIVTVDAVEDAHCAVHVETTAGSGTIESAVTDAGAFDVCVQLRGVREHEHS